MDTQFERCNLKLIHTTYESVQTCSAQEGVFQLNAMKSYMNEMLLVRRKSCEHLSI